MSTTMNNKRKYDDILGRCKNIPHGQTMVNVVLTSVMKPKNPSNSASPWRVFAKYLGDDPAIITFALPTKKQKAANIEPKVYHDNDGEVILGGTVKKNDILYASVFANNIVNIPVGTIVSLALVANMYEHPNTGEKRITYKCNKVIPAGNSDVLTKKVYKDVILNTDLSEVPTRHNINPEDFGDNVEMDKMVRSFALPLASIPGLDVDIILENKPERLMCKKEEATSVGFSMDDDGKSTNNLGVVYKRGDGMKDIMVKFAYEYDFWNQLGIVNMDHWKKIAYQLVSGLKDTYIFGSTNLSRVMNMSPNIHENDEDIEDEDTDPNEVLITTGFISRIKCDMASTIRNIGIKLSSEYVDTKYGPESTHKYSIEHTNHPLNQGWRVKLEESDTQVLNFSELGDDQHPRFWKDIRDMDNIEFWGVPSQENSSDLDTPSEDPKHLPAVVFVIVN